MKNKNFKIAVIANCIFIIIAVGAVSHLYSKYSELLKEVIDSVSSEQAQKLELAKILEADSTELQRIAAQREASLTEEENASLAREQATRDEYEAMMAESQSQSDNDWIYGTWQYSSSYGTTVVVVDRNNIKQYMDGELTYNGSYQIYDNCIHYPDTNIPLDVANQRLMADYNAPFRKVSSSTTNTASSRTSENTTSNTPNIYSADSFLTAVFSARIYNESGGRLAAMRNGLWIGDTMVSGYAPTVVSFNSVGGILKYKMIDSQTLTLAFDFSENMVIGNVSGSSRNMFFKIR